MTIKVLNVVIVLFMVWEDIYLNILNFEKAMLNYYLKHSC